MSVFILGNTSELKPGKSEVEVVIQKRSEKDVKLRPCTKIGTVIAANIVPTTQVGNDFDVDEKERVSCMSAQVESANILGETPHGAQVESANILGETPDGSSDPKDILQKLNLSGIEEWESQLQQEA